VSGFDNETSMNTARSVDKSTWLSKRSLAFMAFMLSDSDGAAAGANRLKLDDVGRDIGKK
jgi:hypothetical protein